MNAQERIFGGDAAKQRADDYAKQNAMRVVSADRLTDEQLAAFKLDVFARRDGIAYEWAVIK
jgi:hypothetical protein